MWLGPEQHRDYIYHHCLFQNVITSQCVDRVQQVTKVFECFRAPEKWNAKFYLYPTWLSWCFYYYSYCLEGCASCVWSLCNMSMMCVCVQGVCVVRYCILRCLWKHYNTLNQVQYKFPYGDNESIWCQSEFLNASVDSLKYLKVLKMATVQLLFLSLCT